MGEGGGRSPPRKGKVVIISGGEGARVLYRSGTGEKGDTHFPLSLLREISIPNEVGKNSLSIFDVRRKDEKKGIDTPKGKSPVTEKGLSIV